MLEPNGPLPPEIYWRRRALAIGILVVALALVIWLVLTVSRGGDTPGSTTATSSSSSTNKQAGGSAGQSASGESGTPGSAEAKPSDSAATTPSGAPAAAGQCPDQSLAVKVTVEQPTYTTGEQPVFGIVITNISSASCTRDVGSGLQQVSVLSLDGQRRLWSSTDCYPDGAPDERTLNPGEQAAFMVTWSGSTSQPNCAGDRVPVPPGAYAVVAQLGSLRSAAEPFNIA